MFAWIGIGLRVEINFKLWFGLDWPLYNILFRLYYFALYSTYFHAVNVSHPQIDSHWTHGQTIYKALMMVVV